MLYAGPQSCIGILDMPAFLLSLSQHLATFDVQNPITIDSPRSDLEISRQKMNYLNNHKIYGITKRF